jgi:hypothetical protein
VLYFFDMTSRLRNSRVIRRERWWEIAQRSSEKEALMRSRILTLAVVVALAVPSLAVGPVKFIRGDVNNSGHVDLVDSVFLLNWLFRGGPAPTCIDSADVNDDGSVNITDVVFLNAYLFQGGSPPGAPFPACGTDPTPDNLSCVFFSCQ